MKQLAILLVVILAGGALWIAVASGLLADGDGAPVTGVAVKSVTLFPEASGRVTAISFDAGRRVNAGNPLLQLDDRAQTLAVDLARFPATEARRVSSSGGMAGL